MDQVNTPLVDARFISEEQRRAAAKGTGFEVWEFSVNKLSTVEYVRRAYGKTIEEAAEVAGNFLEQRQGHRRGITVSRNGLTTYIFTGSDPAPALLIMPDRTYYGRTRIELAKSFIQNLP